MYGGGYAGGYGGERQGYGGAGIYGQANRGAMGADIYGGGMGGVGGGGTDIYSMGMAGMNEPSGGDAYGFDIDLTKVQKVTKSNVKEVRQKAKQNKLKKEKKKGSRKGSEKKGKERKNVRFGKNTEYEIEKEKESESDLANEAMMEDVEDAEEIVASGEKMVSLQDLMNQYKETDLEASVKEEEDNRIANFKKLTELQEQRRMSEKRVIVEESDESSRSKEGSVGKEEARTPGGQYEGLFKEYLKSVQDITDKKELESMDSLLQSKESMSGSREKGGRGSGRGSGRPKGKSTVTEGQKLNKLHKSHAPISVAEEEPEPDEYSEDFEQMSSSTTRIIDPQKNIEDSNLSSQAGEKVMSWAAFKQQEEPITPAPTTPIQHPKPHISTTTGTHIDHTKSKPIVDSAKVPSATKEGRESAPHKVSDDLPYRMSAQYGVYDSVQLSHSQFPPQTYTIRVVVADKETMTESAPIPFADKVYIYIINIYSPIENSCSKPH